MGSERKNIRRLYISLKSSEYEYNEVTDSIMCRIENVVPRKLHFNFKESSPVT